MNIAVNVQLMKIYVRNVKSIMVSIMKIHHNANIANYLTVLNVMKIFRNVKNAIYVMELI